MVGTIDLAKLRRLLDLLNTKIQAVIKASMFQKAETAEAALNSARDLLAAQVAITETHNAEFGRLDERIKQLELFAKEKA